MKIGEYKKEEINDNLLNLSGIADKAQFIKNQKEKELENICTYNKSEFIISNIFPDNNSGYRALSLQIFGREENYNDIRKLIYIFLSNNKENIKKYNFERNGDSISGDKYLEVVKPDQPMGDLELFSFAYLINAELYIFELREDQEIYLVSQCGIIEENEMNKNKIFLNICIIKGTQFQVIYEKNRSQNIFCNKETLIKSIRKNIKKQKSLNIQFEYTKDYRKMRYIDIEKFVRNKMLKKDGPYPDFINYIRDEIKQRNKKREFREMAKKYIIDKDTDRLRIEFNISNKSRYKIFKEFFIVYHIEKINVIKEVHELIEHTVENEKSLDKVVKEYEFWWFGIYQDIKNYKKYCLKCQKK